MARKTVKWKGPVEGFNKISKLIHSVSSNESVIRQTQDTSQGTGKDQSFIIQAVNGYCVAQAFRFEGVPYFRRRDHRVSFGNVKVPVYAEVATTEFLSSLRLNYAYNISVVQPFGPDGKFSLFTVLLACWKLAEVAERDTLQNYGPGKQYHRVMLDFQAFQLTSYTPLVLCLRRSDWTNSHCERFKMRPKMRSEITSTSSTSTRLFQNRTMSSLTMIHGGCECLFFQLQCFTHTL